MENIDSQADKVGIAFVKINDLELVSEFGLGNLPKLVYYRHTTPIVYDGKKTKQKNIFSWKSISSILRKIRNISPIFRRCHRRSQSFGLVDK